MWDMWGDEVMPTILNDMVLKFLSKPSMIDQSLTVGCFTDHGREASWNIEVSDCS
jgi:hypothetical protein